MIINYKQTDGYFYDTGHCKDINNHNSRKKQNPSTKQTQQNFIKGWERNKTHVTDLTAELEDEPQYTQVGITKGNS